MRFKALGTSWGERTVFSNLGRTGASNTQEKIRKGGGAKNLNTKDAKWAHQARNQLKVSLLPSMTFPQS